MKKKILFLSYKLRAGGAEKIMLTIANNLDDNLYDKTIITVADCKDDIALINDNISYKYIFKNALISRIFFKLFYFLSPETLHKIFIKDKYDVEVAGLEGIPSKIISGASDSSNKISIIHSDCNNIAWPRNRYLNFKQELKSYNKFDSLIFVSKDVKNKFKSKFTLIDENKMRVKYNPFNIKEIKLKSIEKVEDIVKRQEFLLCAIGRLEDVKGFDRLIEAIDILRDKGYQLSLIIIGDGALRSKLENIIDEKNLKDNVKLLGWRDNPYKYLYISDCYICTSYSEGLSSTVIEAMILEKMIITTDCGGMNEIIDNGKDGLIVENSLEGIISGIEFTLNKFKNDESRICNQRNKSKRFDLDNYFYDFI